MGEEYFNNKDLIELQLEHEQAELLNLISEIETLSKLVEDKMLLINKKQINITNLELLKKKICN